MKKINKIIRSEIIKFIDLVGKGGYYIKSPSILSSNKIIFVGQNYLLVDSILNKIYVVKLLDVKAYDSGVNIKVLDMPANNEYTIRINLRQDDQQRRYSLLDLDFLLKKSEEFAVRSYCENN